MNRIPKSAQRAIDKANRERTAGQTQRVAAPIPIPTSMKVGETPRGIMNQFDVFFNGERQLLCVFADTVSGVIIRHMSGKGNQPAKGSKLEKVQGKVEIRRRK